MPEVEAARWAQGPPRALTTKVSRCPQEPPSQWCRLSGSQEGGVQAHPGPLPHVSPVSALSWHVQPRGKQGRLCLSVPREAGSR